MKNELTMTQRELKRILKYDKETGVFIWKRKGFGGRGIYVGMVAGAKRSDGYIIIGIDQKNYLAHRLAFLYVKGYLPENQVDHKDRVRDNNCWDNLREVTHSCNLRNCKISKNNNSGITGVYWHKQTQKWMARIGVENKKDKYLGVFDNLKDAAKARYAAEIDLGYPDCNINSSAKKFLDSL